MHECERFFGREINVGRANIILVDHWNAFFVQSGEKLVVPLVFKVGKEVVSGSSVCPDFGIIRVDGLQGEATNHADN